MKKLWRQWISFAVIISIVTTQASAQMSVAIQPVIEMGIKFPITAPIVLAGLALEEGICRAQGRSGIIENLLVEKARKDQQVAYDIRIFEAQMRANWAIRRIRNDEMTQTCSQPPFSNELQPFLTEAVLLFDDFGIFKAIGDGRLQFETEMTKLENNPLFAERFVSLLKNNEPAFQAELSEPQIVPPPPKKNPRDTCGGRKWGILWDFLSFSSGVTEGLILLIIGVLSSYVYITATQNGYGKSKETQLNYIWSIAVAGLSSAAINALNLSKLIERIQACREMNMEELKRLYNPRTVAGRIVQRAVPFGILFGYFFYGFKYLTPKKK